MANLSLRYFFGPLVSLFLVTSCGGGGSSNDTGQSSNNPPQTINPPSAQPELAITSINVVNSSGLTNIQEIDEDATIDIATLPSNFNFVAIPEDQSAVGSVEIVMEGCATIDRTENTSPFTIQAESVGFSTLPMGSCSITATPYSEADENGEEGAELTVSFQITNTGGTTNTPPIISLVGASTISISLGEVYTDMGATATDAEDGDLTASIQIQGADINTLIAGTYLITYLVADAAGSQAIVSRTVIVQEAQPPQITLEGDSVLYTALNESFTDPGATAFDQEDGDLTGSIQVSSNVDTGTLGSYQITYFVTDSSGETAQQTRDVIVVEGGSSSGDVSADIVSMTRVNGVSPETIYFNADGSTCSDCSDLFGLGTQEATAYSVLSYHFNFDDSDSGNFETTGNPRNSQISGSPRAAHTFHCFGQVDPNWDPVDQRCEFDVGVRVQSLDNDFDDAFIRVNIQPTVGVGGYYADSEVTCVSSTSDFVDCLALVPGANTATDVPSVGNWNGRLAIIDNNGGAYSNVCMGANERNGAAIAYGPNLVQGAETGNRPITPTSILSSRPGQCVHSYLDSYLDGMSAYHPSRNNAGELVNGWGFGQKVVGMAIGRVRVGPTGNFIQYHDIAAGIPGGGSGEISIVSAAGYCRNTSDLTCSNMPSPSYIFITDSSSDGDPNNLPVAANIGCFNNCDVTNAVVMGTRTHRSNEHNLRFMGSYGLILSNNWLQGSFVGGAGPKAHVTVRWSGDGGSPSLTRDPEDLTTTSNFMRASTEAGDPANRFNVSVNNWINQESHDANHDGGAQHMIAGFFTVEDGTVYFDDPASANDPKVWMDGVYKVVRNITFGTGSIIDCGQRTNVVPDGSTYNNRSTFYWEGTPNCSGGANTNTGITPLPTPVAP